MAKREELVFVFRSRIEGRELGNEMVKRKE
jgi:hypothetical protein